MTIEAATPIAGPPPRISAWFAAWLAGQIGWTRKSCVQDGPDQRIATFGGPSGDIVVTLENVVDSTIETPRLQVIAITANHEGCAMTYRLVRTGEQVGVEVVCTGQTPLPRMIRLTEFDHAGRISAALESSREDPPYRKALDHMLWIAKDVAAANLPS